MALKSSLDLYGFVENNKYMGISVNQVFSNSNKNKQQDEDINDSNNTIYELKQIIGKMGGDVTFEFPDTVTNKSFEALLKNNGTVKMMDDYTSTKALVYPLAPTSTVTLNLNGKTLDFGNATQSIMTRGNQELTVKGNGTFKNTQGGILFYCNSNTSVINIGGSNTKTFYEGNRPNAELVYCYKGTINITGGIFKNGGSNYLLNCYDANYKNGTAKIVVSGGKFYDFDPGNNTAEGEGTSFLAEGYVTTAATVTEEDGEHTVYTVKKG